MNTKISESTTGIITTNSSDTASQTKEHEPTPKTKDLPSESRKPDVPLVSEPGPEEQPDTQPEPDTEIAKPDTLPETDDTTTLT